MGILVKEVGKLKRYHVSDLAKYDDGSAQPVSEMVDYYDNGATPYILRDMANRYAMKIEKTKDETGNTVSYITTKTEATKTAAIKSGMFEAAPTNLYNQIVRKTANLTNFTRFEYGEGNEQFDADLQESRADGSRKLAIKRLDELAVLSGSSALLIQVLGAKFNYQAIPADKIWIVFNDVIQEQDSETKEWSDRPVNTLSLEEATVIVVQLAEAAEDTVNQTYVAYYPRSDEYENGRQVKYQTNRWYNIPAEHGAGVYEYTTDGEPPTKDNIANPLTLNQDEYDNPRAPEIPIALWYGSSTGYGTTIMPVDTTLFQQCREYDLANSRIMYCMLKSANGITVFQTENGANPVISTNLSEGLAHLRHGQSLSFLNVPVANSVGSHDILNSMMANTMDAWGVNSVLAGIKQTAQFPSGTALIEANKPSSEKRQERTEINRSEMAHIYQIEMALASRENGSEVGRDIKETWIVDNIRYSKTDLELINEQTALIQAKLTDPAHAIVAVNHEIENTEEARELIDTFEIAEEPKQQSGALDVINTGGLRL